MTTIQPIPVTPELTVYEDCALGTVTWEGVPQEGVTYRQWIDAPGTVIIAQPEPGYYLTVPEGSPFGMPISDAAGAATADITFTGEACTITEPAPPPMTELPATGFDPIPYLIIAAACVIAGWAGLVTR